jgi:transketolase
MKNRIIGLKKKMLHIAHHAKQAHLASAFSITEILLAIYDYMDTENDVVLLSKGHACLAQYVILNEKGLISEQELNSFCSYDSILGGHSKLNPDKGISASTGSLGHGLPIAVGMALSKKIKGEKGRVYCIVGDGEFSEGTTFESIQLADKYKLDNLTCIIDMDNTNPAYVKCPWAIFHGVSTGWKVEIPCGNYPSMMKLLEQKFDKPKLFTAYTKKGDGCKTMEQNPTIWHHKAPNDEELEILLGELDNA